MKKYTLNDLPDGEKPRERLKKLGERSLSLQELLALIIERGKADKTVLDISRDLLSKFGNLQNMQEASIEELKGVKGIGTATACKLKACFEIANRLDVDVDNKRHGQKITGSEDVYNLLRQGFKNRKREILKVVSLDSRNKIIDVEQVSIGIVNANIAHPREVFRSAIKSSAAGIILVHNHPSGEANPSASDIKNTKDIKESGKTIGIPLKDHIIIGKDNYFSFLDEDYL